MKTRYDSTATDYHFKEGDLVWMYNPKQRRVMSTKLQPNWEGPYTVAKKLNNVVYRLQRSPNAKPKVIHINRQAPYRATDHSSKICHRGFVFCKKVALNTLNGTECWNVHPCRAC
ncbi:hypothetical protein AVEN_74984-1 [Araneus ventricosus]|uniref:Integrase p58-like C-terminal domain-containing protein n=1 Tax=Araneus ventricosus TaxID=182803 RepID=A0A4Y2FYE6_ARAVE|nr:hypothetical protein AVEN_74984-1 [Araneus ventricosus]